MNALKILQSAKVSIFSARANLLSNITTKVSVFRLFFATFCIQQYYLQIVKQPNIAYAKTEKKSKEEEESSKSQIKTKSNEIIELSKQDYYDKIMGNDKDFFFLIIYEDKGDNKSESTQIGTFLKSILDENEYSGFNVYFINRQAINSVRQLITRATESNLFDGNTTLPIEIYLKTPYSYDYMYFKYKSSSFLTQKSRRRYRKIIKKVRNLIEFIDSESALMDYLFKGSQKFGQVSVLRCLEATSNKDETQEYLKNYSKLAFSSLEAKYLPRKANFLLIRDPKLMAKYHLHKDFLYVLNHDLIHAFENRYGEQIENKTEYQQIMIPSDFISQISLSKVYQPLVTSGKKKILSEEEKTEKWNQDLSAFFNSVTPRMFLIKDTKYSTAAQFFKKSLQTKSKYTISLYCSKFDPNREQKVRVFMELYKKYKNNFHFIVVENESVEDIFPHATPEYPELALFDFFQLKKTYQEFEGYYKSPIYPYKKHFLRSFRGSSPQLEEIEKNIQKFLRGELKENYLTKQEGRVQILKRKELSEILEYSKKANKPLLISVSESLDQITRSNTTIREIAVEHAEKNPPINMENGIIFGKIDKVNLSGFSRDFKSENIIYYNPTNDCLFQASFPSGLTDEEAKQWIYKLIEIGAKIS